MFNLEQLVTDLNGVVKIGFHSEMKQILIKNGSDIEKC